MNSSENFELFLLYVNFPGQIDVLGKLLPTLKASYRKPKFYSENIIGFI
jgi:hypothetical protein